MILLFGSITELIIVVTLYLVITGELHRSIKVVRSYCRLVTEINNDDNKLSFKVKIF